MPRKMLFILFVPIELNEHFIQLLYINCTYN
jgi:hypothetical protein